MALVLGQSGHQRAAGVDAVGEDVGQAGVLAGAEAAQGGTDQAVPLASLDSPRRSSPLNCL